MKKIYLLFTIIALSFVSLEVNAQTITFNQAFTQFQAPTTQCTAWGVFRSELLSSYCYTGFTIRGSRDMVGISCTDPAVALDVANALRTGTAYTGASNGQTWNVGVGCTNGDCGNGAVELYNFTGACQCANGAGVYIVRPEINNANWGGIVGPTCSAESQTLIVEFFTAPLGPPTITCPANITVNNTTSNCGAAVTYTAPTVSSCGPETTIQTAGLASGSVFPVGTTTNTFESTNADGTSTCSFTVTVTDNENPTITCPADITINTDAGQCTSTEAIGTATGTDNCGVPTITNDAPASFPIGNTTVTWTSTDAASNFVTCTQVVTVVDNENPTITCPTNISVSNDAGLCDAVVNYTAPIGTDNCTGATTALTAGLGSGATFPIGTTTETYTVTDAANNTSSCSFTITVTDTENPTITCPPDITINTDAGQCTSTEAIGTATGTDNCGVPTITSDAPASFPIGNTTVTWTSTDAESNFVTCTQVVTVVDNENPTITCPADITINTDAGQCTSTETIGTATGTDNCGVPTITNDAPASFPIGNTTVTWTSTDSASNFVTCTQEVTVVDNENPTITCPTEVASCDSVVNGIAPTVSDNCTGETIEFTLSGATTGSGVNDASGTLFNIGVTTVEYTVTDASNNQDNCSFTVTINPLPSVELDAFTQDTVCETASPFALPVGTPAGGIYSGNGVSGSNFDPNAAGVNSHYIIYTFTDANACSNMDSTLIVVESCAGINETNGLTGVHIYPNPANAVINVSFDNITTAVNFTLTSAEGKIVYNENNVNSDKVVIDIRNNAKGVYFLRIETNNQYAVYKVIKQ